MEKIQFIQTDPNALANLIDEKIKHRLEELKKNFTPQEPDEFLNSEEASKLLKISIMTLYRWVDKGILKVYKFGNKNYYSRKEIIEKLYNSNK